MASINKKNKAKNSYLHNGFDKYDGKFKRYVYFAKRERNKNRKQLNEVKEYEIY